RKAGDMVLQRFLGVPSQFHAPKLRFEVAGQLAGRTKLEVERDRWRRDGGALGIHPYDDRLGVSNEIGEEMEGIDATRGAVCAQLGAEAFGVLILSAFATAASGFPTDGHGTSSHFLPTSGGRCGTAMGLSPPHAAPCAWQRRVTEVYRIGAR